jgi:hypothetical protein
VQKVLENPGCPYPGQPAFSGTGDIYIYRYLEKTYVGGVGQKVKSLLDAEEFAGNRNGLCGQDFSWIASSRGFGQLLVLGVSSIHGVGVIPLDAVLLKGSKALVTLRQQGDAALKFWRVKKAGPGCCLAEMEGQGRARPRCSLSRSSGSRLCPGLDDLFNLESAGLDRGSGLVWDRGLGRGSGLGRGRSLLN